MDQTEVEVDGTLIIPDGYTKGKKQAFGKYRNPRNIAEMIEHCSKHSHITFLSTDNTARNCKVNGAVKTWKRNPNRVEVPIKYGMYEYGTFYAEDIGRILIPVSSGS